MLAHLEQERGSFEPQPECPQKLLLVGKSSLDVTGRTVRMPKVFVVPESLEILALWWNKPSGGSMHQGLVQVILQRDAPTKIPEA